MHQRFLDPGHVDADDHHEQVERQQQMDCLQHGVNLRRRTPVEVVDIDHDPVRHVGISPLVTIGVLVLLLFLLNDLVDRLEKTAHAADQANFLFQGARVRIVFQHEAQQPRWIARLRIRIDVSSKRLGGTLGGGAAGLGLGGGALELVFRLRDLLDLLLQLVVQPPCKARRALDQPADDLDARQHGARKGAGASQQGDHVERRQAEWFVREIDLRHRVDACRDCSEARHRKSCTPAALENEPTQRLELTAPGPQTHRQIEKVVDVLIPGCAEAQFGQVALVLFECLCHGIDDGLPEFLA